MAKFTADELKAVEDKAIIDLVEKQKKAGYHVITDGEFRRATWHLDFMWGFKGVAHKKTEKGVAFSSEAALIDDTWLTGKISGENHPLLSISSLLKILKMKILWQSRLFQLQHSSSSRWLFLQTSKQQESFIQQMKN